jgi:hypothetical protein
MRRILIPVIVLVVAGVTASAALAAHFTKNGDPACSLTNGQVTCSAEMAGLGNEDIVISLGVSGEASFNCVQPGQSKKSDPNIAPGANKVPFEDSAGAVIPDDAIKNGRARIGPITSPVQQPTATAEDAGCPNGTNWTTQLAGVTVQSVTFSASQGDTQLFYCTASGSFTSGTIPLTCS